MLFIYDTKISDFKRIDLALRDCFGIGLIQSWRIFVKLGFNRKLKMKILSKKLFSQLDRRILQVVKYFFHLRVEAVYKNYVHTRMKTIKASKSLRGLRHYFRLPVRGQRTKNNAQTQKKRRPNWKRVPIAKKKK
jgi:ribosomal protein S13